MAGALDANEIYEAARAAGFSPDQSVTMTAIALAESGGNPGAHNPNNEDSRGLWQINLEAHGGAPWTQGLDMYNPRDNAIAAWHVSQQGADISPWTVTHQERGARYTAFAEEARQAAASHGEPANGNFDAPTGYGDQTSAGAPGGAPFAAPAPPMVPEPVDDGIGSVDRFLEAALAQQGDTYIMNAHTEPTDPNPEEFDCSELVEWAAAQTGVQVSEASYLQYLDMKEAGTLIPVEQALNTPGALLFRFPSEPVPGASRQDGSHVAISLGDGRTIEAKNSDEDVGIFENAADRGFNYAALIPGMDYENATLPTMEPPPAPVPAEPNPLDVALWNSKNPEDADVDMLPDHFEIKYGLDPAQADTDGDGITDGYELIVLGTKPDLLDTDFDGISDGLEISLGYDPLVADNPDPDAPLAPPDDLLLDTDGDGITDWGEELARTRSDDPDTDDDTVLDGDELILGTDPLSADS
jgi:cell wall-associated NlpC family hydrolase